MPISAHVSPHLVAKMLGLCQMAIEQRGIIVRVESQHDVLLLRQQIYNVRKHLHRVDPNAKGPLNEVELRIKKPEQDEEGRWAMHIVPLGDAYAEFNITNLGGKRLLLRPSGDQQAAAADAVEIGRAHV